MTTTTTIPGYLADRVTDILIATTLQVVGAENQMKATNILAGQCDVAAAIFDDRTDHLRKWLTEQLADFHSLRPQLKLSRTEMVRRELLRRWRVE